MLQINPFLDCTIYSGIIVHIGRNTHLRNAENGFFITIRLIQPQYLGKSPITY